MAISFVKLYKNSVAIKILYWAVVNFFAAIIVLFLYIIKPFKFVKLFLLVDERIGHLADHTELLLRRMQLGIIKSEGITFVGIAGRTPANKQLLKMFKREITIIQIPKPEFVRVFLRSVFSEKSLFGKSVFYQPVTCRVNEYYEFNYGKPSLSFTPEEEKGGKELLQKLGIPAGAWFVCFHSRDPVYLFKKYGKKTRDYDIRDANIKNYLKAAEYITSCGGYAIRMGSAVSEKLPPLKNPKIIDYATKSRNDFLDIYLLAKCKFFLGSTAGLWCVPTIFNVPIAGTNFFHFHTPYKKIDLFIPKKVLSKIKKRFLAIREILDWQHKVGHPAGYVRRC